MDFYDELAVKKYINGNATLTRLGGSIMPPIVVAAMAEASRHFVDIDDLEEKVGARLAELTHNEAAYVCSGAAAGIVLATAACIAGIDPLKRAKLPNTRGMRNEIVLHRYGKVEFDFAIRQAGGRLVEIGRRDGADVAELERAITDRTAAVFYFYNEVWEGIQVPLQQGIDVAHSQGVPVIVDAAAQLPPAENLWRFTRMGADLVLFSGGKGLCGPQSSGLILGRKELIEACAFHACPRHFIGRPMKVGKEEIIGLLAAVEWYLGTDQDALIAAYEDQVNYIVTQMCNVEGCRARRSFPSEAGQPIPRAELIFDESRLGVCREDILSRLLDGDPGISLAPAGEGGVYINPQTLRSGEEKIIVDRIKAILAGQEDGGRIGEG